MSDFTTKTGNCIKCKAIRKLILHLKFSESAAKSFVWICSECKSPTSGNGGGLWIAKETIERHLSDEQIDNLPVLMPFFYKRCARCGARGAELHHWAPKAIFGEDAEKWPQDYLCKACHDNWHLMVTPQLVK